jgi:putative hydrolase of the HAD superfamily
MRFAELDAVTVDGFGTLVTLRDPTEALAEALARHGAAIAPPAVARAFRAEVEYYRPRALEGRDAASLARLREQCAAVFLGAAGAALEPAAFVDDFVGALEFDLVPGALDAIRSLGARGLDVAVVANWDASLPEHLERLGASAHVSAVVTSASAGAAKPDPAIFHVALERLGVPASRALHVGDEPLDEQGARGAGMRFLAAPLTTAFAGWT